MNCNIFSSSYEKNPNSYFEFLRNNDPVHYEESVKSYFISKYSDVKFILDNPDFFSTKTLAKRAQPVMKEKVLAQMYGDEHAKKKRIIMKSISGENLNFLFRTMSNRAKEILEKGEKSNKIDLVHEFGKEFAVKTSLDMLGIDIKDYKLFLQWHDGITKYITSFNLSDEEKLHSIHCSDKLEEYLLPIIKEKAAVNDGTIISKLFHSNIKFTEKEILALTLNILLAATEPVDKTISYLFFNLLKNQNIFEQVKNDRTKIKNAILETLRLNSPVQFIPRQLEHDYVLNGKQLHKDDTVICMIGAANRDPNFFTNPDSFDIERKSKSSNKFKNAPNLAFGSGIHRCVGANFSLNQIELITNIILDKYNDIALLSPVIEETGIYTRGPKNMVIKIK